MGAAGIQHKRLALRMKPAAQSNRDELKQAIADNGGDRLERLAAEIRKNGAGSRCAQAKADRFASWQALRGRAAADRCGIASPPARTNIKRWRDASEESRCRPAKCADRTWRKPASGQAQEHAQLTAEIDSLKRRRSNIDDARFAIRDALCAALGR